MTTRKARGRRTQAAVAAAFRDHGWTAAESTPASVPGDDITGVPGLSVEVKGRRGFDPLAALRQAEKRSPGQLHLAVLRMDGQGEAADDYPVVLRLGALLDLLAGHPDHRPDADDLAASMARHPSGRNLTLGTPGMVIYR